VYLLENPFATTIFATLLTT